MSSQFDNIEELIDHLPDDERGMFESLRDLILDAIPDVREEMINNSPCYFRHGKICYIRAAAFPKGNIPYYGVELGFFEGYLLSNEDRYLTRGRRTRVLTKTYAEEQEIDPERIRALLYEAVELDEDPIGRS